MIVACNEKIGYYNTQSNEIDNPKNYRWTCPNCNEEVIHVRESNRIEHFRHYSNSRCVESEPETKAHINMKTYFADFFNGKLEVKIGNRIADVVVDKLVIEVQNSNLSLHELEKRTSDFEIHGFKVAWILNPIGLVVGSSLKSDNNPLLEKYDLGDIFFSTQDKRKEMAEETGVPLSYVNKISKYGTADDIIKINVVENWINKRYGSVLYLHPYSKEFFSLKFSDYKDLKTVKRSVKTKLKPDVMIDGYMV